MQLQLCTWLQVEDYLKRSNGIILPIGSTEQHGPNGLVGTDALCAEVIARGVGEAADALVAPTISVGMAQFHLDFPGSMTLTPTTLIAVIRDYVASLSRHGFTHFYFLNGHGGNVATLSAAFQEIYAGASFVPGGNRPAVRCRLKSWWDNPSVSAICDELYGGWEGFHATASEVAITQYAFPNAVTDVDMGPPVALHDSFAVDHLADEYYEAEDFRRRFPDGRVGSDPSLSRPEHGKRVIEAAVAEMRADYEAFLTE